MIQRRTYNPRQLLIGIHVPKSAGTSLREVLYGWFGPKGMHPHYMDEVNNRLPPRPNWLWRLRHRLPWRRHSGCIYGHFNRERNMSLEGYYPQVQQFFTFFRDPFRTLVSLYFYTKQLGEQRYLDGELRPLNREYPDLRAYLSYQITKPYYGKYLPADLTLDNYPQVLAERFVYVGLAEDMPASIQRLAQRLGMPPVAAPRLNESIYDEPIPQDLEAEYRRTHSLEYALYEYAQATYAE